jgi:hypothetical protein
MGHFDAATGTYSTESPDGDLYVGTPAGVRGRGREPLARRGLNERAKQLVPGRGRREGDPPPSPFDGWGSKADRRDLTKASEFVASLESEHAEQLGTYLDAEQAELDKAGEAEDGRQLADERIKLILDLDERTEARAGEMVESPLAFLDWASAEFGGDEQLQAYLDQQEDPQEALVELAAEFLEGGDEEPTEGDLAYGEWLAETIGEEGIAQLQQMGDEEFQEANAHLAEAFLAEHPEYAGSEDRGDWE